MGKPAPVIPVPTISSQVEFITPTMAAEMLAANTNNRSISKTAVSAYAQDMRAGQWQLNGDAVRFAQDGTLLDGQHRLQAVIDAEVSGVSMFVIRGLPADTFKTIDNGRKRTAGDILNLGHIPNYNVVASAARAALLYSSGGIVGDNASRIATTDFVAAHPYIVETAALAQAHRGQLNASPLAAVLFLGNERRLFDDDVETFLEGISTGANMEAGDPRLTLREWATNERIRRRGQLATGLTFFAIARAWTAHVKGERLKIIKIHGLGRPSRATVQIAGFNPPAGL